jgi:hypothetical protein
VVQVDSQAVVEAVVVLVLLDLPQVQVVQAVQVKCESGVLHKCISH